MFSVEQTLVIVIATIPLIIGEFHVTPIRELLKKLEEAVLQLIQAIKSGSFDNPALEEPPDPQRMSKDAVRRVEKYRTVNRLGFVAVIIVTISLLVLHKMEEDRVDHEIQAWLLQAATGQPNGQKTGVPLEDICEALPREYPMHLIVRAIENSEVIKKVRFDLCPGTAANGVTVPVGKKIWLYSL